ncbi:uncharacterized protein EI90DRAFT_3076953 [Cantharellus anzutake]|uniref:uncharacterized protein n=1 Tax=Cantharellus anzutake TaxID=1750568 RepID=UPI001906A7F7|nr:uncharacterized protein EI90DRAFT_3076953 [Cantharellus anzutake]KAF8323535.1 hypothetical protein EI90DRAFT_3076953 [Cantharellus anzutake]
MQHKSATTDPAHLHHIESDSSETHSSDEFDWEADIEERVVDLTKKATRLRRLWLLFLKLSSGLRITLFGILGSAIFITPYLVFLLRFPHSVVYKQVTTWSIWFSVTWAAGALTSLVVNASPRLILGLILTIWGKPPEHIKTYLELFMAVSFWLKLALDISWLWIALGLIRSQVQPPGHYWLWVNRTCSALFAAGILLLAEKVLLQFIAIRFHQKALANHLALRALDKLSVAPAASKPRKRREQQSVKPHKHLDSRGSSMDILNTIGPGQTQNPYHNTSGESTVEHSKANSPIERSRRNSYDEPVITEKIGSKGRKNDRGGRSKRKKKKITAAVMEQLGVAIGQVALKNSKFNRAGEIGSLYSARQLAKQLFANLSSTSPRSYLVVEDFYPYFKSKEEATSAFHLFDKDDNGDISKKEMREAVQSIYRERKALTASLKDISSAVAKLDGVLVVVTLLILFFICLLILNPNDTVQSLVPLATLVLGFRLLIFIFSTHPFDVGDLVIIDDQVLFVKEFGLFSTVFTRVDGQEIIAPNSLLASSKILHNVRRSGSMWETTNLMVAYDTPLQQLETFKLGLRTYMAENSREWGGCEVYIDKMEFQNEITLIIAIEHRANWQNWGARWDRRTKFMRRMKALLEELDIGYCMPLQPVSFHPSSVSATNARPGHVGGERVRGQAPDSTMPAQYGRY